MGVAVIVAVSLILGVSTMLLAGSHNRAFDSITKRSERPWWSPNPPTRIAS